MEYAPENNIFALKMMMKSGLEKNILKFLHVFGNFWEFFGNSLGILWKFYWNSLEILSEFFGHYLIIRVLRF